MAGESWTNWAGNQTHEVVALEHPASVEELTAVITSAAANDERVKAVGSGHSFTGIALTDGRSRTIYHDLFTDIWHMQTY